jgi:tetratricopeptide (TPR) repeat protein
MQRALAIAPNDPAVLKDATLLYGRLAGFDNTQSRGADASRHAQQAVGYAERNVAARQGDFDAREILAGSVFYLGVAEPAEHWTERVAIFERAASLYRALLAERPQKENLVRNVGITGRYLASLYHDRRDEARAIDHGRRALDTSELVLSKRPADPALQLDAATDAMQLGTMLDGAARLDDGERQYRRAIALTEGMLTGENGNARARILFSESARNLARNRLRAGAVEEARSWADRAVTTYDAMHRAGQMPEGVKWRFAEALAVRGDVAPAGQQPRACADYHRSVELFDETERTSPLVDLVKDDAARTRAALSACPKS